MTLRWVDGFELTYRAEDLNKKYQAFGLSGAQQGSGHLFGNAVRAAKLRLPAFAAKDKWTVGVDINMEHAGFLADSKLRFFLGDEEQCRLEFSASGSGWVASFHRGSTTLATMTRVLTFNTWYYLELQVLILPVSGAYELRINSEDLLSASDINTAHTGDSQASAIGIESGMWMDHIYVLDSDGASENSFLGPQIVEGIYPHADGDTLDWSPNTGSDHYVLIDDPASTGIDDSDYIAADGSGEVDIFRHENLIHVAGSINGVALLQAVFQDTVGSRDIQGVYKSPGGNTALFDARSVHWIGVREIVQAMGRNPETATRWRNVEIDDGQWGVKLQS